jgi:hypothetical protein
LLISADACAPPYDPDRHGALQRVLNQDQPAAASHRATQVVITLAGLDISGLSVDYVAGGSGGDLDVLEAARAAIHGTAAAAENCRS